MHLTEAITVFTNPETQSQDKVVLAAATIAAEMKIRPSLVHLLNLIPNKKYKVNESAPLADLTDQLGFLKAEIKDLEDGEAKIKEILHVSGEKTVDGAYYTVTIGEDYTNTTISLVDLKKKAPKLYKQLEPYIKHSNCIGKITVRAKG